MTIPTALAGAIAIALLALVGTLFGILFNRVAHLEKRISDAEGLVTRLREWAIKAMSRYYMFRKDGSPDLDDLPDLEH